MTARKLKSKKCKACKNSFTPDRPLQQVCGYQCAIEYARIQDERKKAKERKQRLNDLQPVKFWLDKAQVYFNSYVRERDRELPCISCQRPIRGQAHCGHYRTRKAAPQLRFSEDNCHKQCAQCNNFDSGNVVEYRINLAKKIGEERVQALENNNEIKRWTREEAEEIISTYKEKLKELKSSPT